jgi:hypothetical protein
MNTYLVFIDESSVPANPGEGGNPGKAGAAALLVEIQDFSVTFQKALATTEVRRTKGFLENVTDLAPASLTLLGVKIAPYSTQNRACLMMINAVLSYMRQPANLYFVFDAEYAALAFSRMYSYVAGQDFEYISQKDENISPQHRPGRLYRWSQKNFKKVENKDLWRSIVDKIVVNEKVYHRVSSIWMRAHTSLRIRPYMMEYLNDFVDKKARHIAGEETFGDMCAFTAIDDLGYAHPDNRPGNYGMRYQKIAYTVFPFDVFKI